MASYDRIERVTHTVEFHIPDRGYGACWTDVLQVFNRIRSELVQAGELAPDQEPSADRIRVFAGDEVIIVSYQPRI